jgi:hypothetical protein
LKDDICRFFSSSNFVTFNKVHLHHKKWNRFEEEGEEGGTRKNKEAKLLKERYIKTINQLSKLRSTTFYQRKTSAQKTTTSRTEQEQSNKKGAFSSFEQRKENVHHH